MKNIHVLKTDKPSKLYFNHNKEFEKYQFSKEPFINGLTNTTNQHIYITSDEYIGLSYYLDGNLVRKGVVDDKDYWEVRQDYKKIILTTDQDLIKDGVQAIDDEFLEWFVKNPLCDYISTPIIKLCENCGQQFCDNRDCRGYIDKPYYLLAYPETITERTITYCDGYEINSKEIIIPKEETKQKWDINTCRYWNMEIGCEREKCICENTPIEEPKQETLEEAAESYGEPYRCPATNENEYCKHDIISAFNNGAKWQAERMYSEEEVEEIVSKLMHEVHCGDIVRTEYAIDFKLSPRKWFEQFKKK